MLTRVLGVLTFSMFWLLPVNANASCEVVVEGNGMLQFVPNELTLDSSCETITVVFKNTSTMARNIMGHNWVLLESGDLEAVAADGLAAGLDNEYLKPGDERVVATSKVIGGGESDTVIFAGSKLDKSKSYSFVCTFAGHAAIMRGTVAVN